jgi:hypothetical protein
MISSFNPFLIILMVGLNLLIAALFTRKTSRGGFKFADSFILIRPVPLTGPGPF